MAYLKYLVKRNILPHKCSLGKDTLRNLHFLTVDCIRVANHAIYGGSLEPIGPENS